MDFKPLPVTIGVAVRHEEPGTLRRFVMQASNAAHVLDEQTESEVCFCLNGASSDTSRYLNDALRELSDPELHFRCIESPPGKIRAHAAIARSQQLNGYLLFVDADVVFDSDLFVRLFRYLQRDPIAQACYAEVEALPSVAGGVFGRLQNAYYRQRHRLRQRAHLHGRCFMLRSWIEELESLRSPLADSIELDDPMGLHHGPIVDDIHYSRVLVHRFGRHAIALVPDARVRFVPPHSIAELYRDSCRTELELARLDVLFPEHAYLEKLLLSGESGMHRCWDALWRAGLPAAAYVAIERVMRRFARNKARRRMARLSEGGICPSVTTPADRPRESASTSSDD